MKNALLVLAAIVLSLGGYSQGVIPNGGFETSTTQPLPCGGGSPYLVPGGGTWVSLNISPTYSYADSTMTLIAAGAHSGNNLLRLVTDSGCSPLYSNFRFSGLAAMAPAAVGVTPPATITVTGGAPFTSRPDSLSGWYKYFPVGGDTFAVHMLLSKWNGSSRDTVGTVAYKHSGAQATWAQFIDTIHYRTAGAPDTMFILILASPLSIFSTHDGTVLFIDDLLLSGIDSTSGGGGGGGMGLGDVSENQKVSLYPNPAKREITVNLTGTKGGTLFLMNILGQKMMEFNVDKPTATFDIGKLEDGVYIYRFVGAKTGVASTGRLVVNK